MIEQDRTIYAYDMATSQSDTDKEVWTNRVFASGYSTSMLVGLRSDIGSFTEAQQAFQSYVPDLRAAIRDVVLKDGRLYLRMRPGLSSSSVVRHFRTRHEFVLEVGAKASTPTSRRDPSMRKRGCPRTAGRPGSLTWTAGEELVVRLKTAPVPDGLTVETWTVTWRIGDLLPISA